MPEHLRTESLPLRRPDNTFINEQVVWRCREMSWRFTHWPERPVLQTSLPEQRLGVSPADEFIVRIQENQRGDVIKTPQAAPPQNLGSLTPRLIGLQRCTRVTCIVRQILAAGCHTTYPGQAHE